MPMMRMRAVASAAVLAAMSMWAGGVLGARAQVKPAVPGPSNSMMLTEPPIPLLGPSMLGVARQGDAQTAEGAACLSLGALGPVAGENIQAGLREDGVTRCSTATYAGVGAVTAIQFKDATGAYAAWTSLLPGNAQLTALPGGAKLVEGKSPARAVALAQTIVLLAPRGNEAALKHIIAALPKVSGRTGLPPLLPTFLPGKELEDGSLRYAEGPAGFMAGGMGKGLPSSVAAQSLGWEKNAEAAEAHYTLTHKPETVTLLLYPTPQIAGEHLRALGNMPNGATRREGELVIVAAGDLDTKAASELVGSIHMSQIGSIDRPMPPSFHGEVQKTASLLTSIMVFTGILGAAAVLMALFLGGGRAMLRKLQGKSAATEAEFLSLHLASQNAPVQTRAEPPVS